MNAFQLLITAAIALAVLFVGYNLFQTYFNPHQDIGPHAEGLLIESQGDLGHAHAIALTIAEDQTLFARNLDSPTRTVSFACTEPICCETAGECPLPFTNTGERIIANQTTKTTLTGRCIPTAGIHACKIYVGRPPAQIEWESLFTPEAVSLQNDPRILVSGVLVNTGEVEAEQITVEANVYGLPANPNEEKPLVASNAVTISPISPSESEQVVIEIPVTFPGTHELELIATGEDSGYLLDTFSLEITGETVSLCQRDKETTEEAEFDGFLNLCRQKKFCTECDFTFECRAIWNKQAPLTQGGYYDPDRGEPSFTYALYPPFIGNECDPDSLVV